MIDNYYICNYCKRKFPLVNGYSVPNLIDHLERDHPDEINEIRHLYLSDVVKTCFELQRRTDV